MRVGNAHTHTHTHEKARCAYTHTHTYTRANRNLHTKKKHIVSDTRGVLKGESDGSRTQEVKRAVKNV
jgi:hypothetical protein